MLGNTGTSTAADIFWGELAPSEHLLQIYEHDDVFLDTLESFVASGLNGGEAVIVIATRPHAEGLDERLAARGIPITTAKLENRYIVLNAEETLAQFTDDGWPNDDRFNEIINGIVHRARGGNGRRVRAFGEMVAILWDRGHNAATVRLEYLWHKKCQEKEFSLFCAYPKAGFTDYALKSLQDICDAHSRVVN